MMRVEQNELQRELSQSINQSTSLEKNQTIAHRNQHTPSSSNFCRGNEMRSRFVAARRNTFITFADFSSPLRLEDISGKQCRRYQTFIVCLK